MFQRSHSHITPENLAIFTTPRRLIRSLQDIDDNSLHFHGKNTRHYTGPSSCKLESPRRRRGNGLFHSRTLKDNKDRKSSVESEKPHQSSESISSTEDAFADTESQCITKAVPESKTKSQGACTHSAQQTSNHKMICGFLVIVISMLAFLLWDEDQDGFYNLVPT